MPARTQDRTQAGSSGDATTAPVVCPTPFTGVSMPPSSSSNISPPSTPSDVDVFSVISYGPEEASTPEGPSITSLCGHSFTQFSNNPISYLAFIVERGINLCETRRSLEEGILKSLERNESHCLNAVESSKDQLAMMRRNAVDIAARLKGASGGIIGVTLPWLDGVESGAYDSEKKSRCPTPISAPYAPRGPAMAPPPPESITGALNSTLHTNSPAFTMCSQAVLDHWFPAVPPIHSPVSPALSIVSVPGPPCSVAAVPIPTISPPSPTCLPASGQSIDRSVSCQYDST